MKMNFCTLFNSSYLSRGLALYESLQDHTNDFHLYIFAFDDQSFEILTGLALEHATIISLHDFENEELLAVKKKRSVGEYCWTCTSSCILYCLDHYNLDHCTYLDADLYFFDSPEPLLQEIGEKSILITEHRYTAKYDQSHLSGKYCVQFMYFRNNEEGRKCLTWWVDACLDWCYAKVEDGKFGDQKYLDDWKDRFEGVHELQHLGGGVAPWNIQQYEFKWENDKLRGLEISSGKTFNLIFYHFHKLNFLLDDVVDVGDYELMDSHLENIYKPYLKHLEDIRKNILDLYSIDPHGKRKDVGLIRRNYRLFKRRLKGLNNRFKLQDLLEN